MKSKEYSSWSDRDDEDMVLVESPSLSPSPSLPHPPHQQVEPDQCERSSGDCIPSAEFPGLTSAALSNANTSITNTTATATATATTEAALQKNCTIDSSTRTELLLPAAERKENPPPPEVMLHPLLSEAIQNTLTIPKEPQEQTQQHKQQQQQQQQGDEESMVAKRNSESTTATTATTTGEEGPSGGKTDAGCNMEEQNNANANANDTNTNTNTTDAKPSPGLWKLAGRSIKKYPLGKSVLNGIRDGIDETKKAVGIASGK